MKPFRLPTFLILLSVFTAAGAAQGTFGSDLLSLTLGENITMNATVYNPLPVQDTITVVFSGPAIGDNRIVTPHFPPSVCPEVFTSGQERCNVNVPAQGRANISTTLEGTAFGQARLTATVNSSQTGLSSSDQLEIRVSPSYGAAANDAPGITIYQLLALAVLAGASVFYRR